MPWLVPPILVPALTALACAPAAGARWGRHASLAGAALTLALALALAARVLEGGPVVAAGGLLQADALSALLACLVSVVALAVAWHGAWKVPREERDGAWAPWAAWTAGRFDVALHALLASLMLAALANDLSLLWIALVAAILAAVLLVAYPRTPEAVGAAWRLLILDAVGLALALLATMLVYHAAAGAGGGPGLGLRWAALRQAAPLLDPHPVRLGFLFALVGYGTVAGLAPLHAALPGAEREAPPPAAAMLSAALVPAALVALLRFHAIAARCVGPGWSGGLLVLFGLVSMLVAVPFVLVQGDFKRLLAHSGVGHVGFVALAVGLGAPLALLGGLFHLLGHSLARALAFLVGDALEEATGTRRMDHWSGLLAGSPALGTLFVGAGVALAGLPPLATFLSAWLVVTGGLAAARTGVVALAVAALVAAFVGLAFHWTRAALDRSRGPLPDPRPALARVPLWAMLALLLALGVWLPAPLRALLERAAGAIGP